MLVPAFDEYNFLDELTILVILLTTLVLLISRHRPSFIVFFSMSYLLIKQMNGMKPTIFRIFLFFSRNINISGSITEMKYRTNNSGQKFYTLS